jgi:ABC-type polysaccharide/polyol phosphate export permease
MALLSKCIYYSCIYTIYSLCILPVGKIILWNSLDLTRIHYPKFILIVVLQNIFYACFTISVSSLIKGIAHMGSIWARYIFPLWFMGGFQFSWSALYHVSPYVAYITLLNPVIYITEATRAALLGQENYINFWFCLVMITIFSVISFYIGIRNLKKRLDFI